MSHAVPSCPSQAITDLILGGGSLLYLRCSEADHGLALLTCRCPVAIAISAAAGEAIGRCAAIRTMVSLTAVDMIGALDLDEHAQEQLEVASGRTSRLAGLCSHQQWSAQR